MKPRVKKLAAASLAFIMAVTCFVGINTEKAVAEPTETAYAVLDADGNFTFFRSTETYENKATGTFTDTDGDSYSGTVFADFENLSREGWGNVKWKDYMGNIKKVSMAQPVVPVDISYWFYGATALEEADLSKIDSSNLTKMEGTFSGDTNLKSLDIRSLKCNNVTSMDGLIHGLKALYRICLGGEFGFTKTAKDEVVPIMPTEAFVEFNSATGLLRFFRDEEGKYTNGQTDGAKTYYAGVESTGTTTSIIPWYSQRRSVTSVIIEDAIKPAETAYWFYEMRNLTSITGLEKLDTSKVTSMRYMFSNCLNLATLDVSHFDTSKVTTMDYMFFKCLNLATLDVSHFDTSNVTDMRSMFNFCANLTNIYASNNWSVGNVTNSTNMFSDCFNLPNFNPSYDDKTNAHYNEGGYLTNADTL